MTTKSPGDDAPQWTDEQIIAAMRDDYEKQAKKSAALFRNRKKQIFEQDDDA